MAANQTNYERPTPLRVSLGRRIIQEYNLSRGKDRLFLTLNSILRFPRETVIDISGSVKLHVDLSDYLQRWMFCHKLTDEFDYHMIREILREGDHFVDVGANIGIVSLIASEKIGDTGKVYAIEASPQIRQLLERNIRLNRADNVYVVPFALLDSDREVEFYVSTSGNIGGSSLSSEGQKASATVVNGRTFDGLMADGTIGKCDVLKMDIEGAELMALKGMGSLFSNAKPRAVMIEISDELLAEFQGTPGDVINFFLEHGYAWYRAASGGFETVTDLNIKGFNNLWAILPNGVEKQFLI